MTIEQMRAIVGLPLEASDAEVVAAYAALTADGFPASIDIVEPVTVDQVRLHCRLDDDFDDALIGSKISAAREWVEDEVGRIIVQRTMIAYFTEWRAYLEILHRPIVSIDAVTYAGPDGDATYSGWTAQLGAPRPRIYPGPGGWPSLRPGGGIMVAYTAGYDAGEVPARMIEAVLVFVAGMLSHRTGAYDQSLAAAKALLKRLRPPRRV